MNIYISSVQSPKPYLRRNANLAARVAVKKGLGPISNALFMGIILTLLGLMYLSQVTKANDYSFTISSLEQRRTELIDENTALSVQALRLAKIENVNNTGVAKSLTDPKSVEYIR